MKLPGPLGRVPGWALALAVLTLYPFVPVIDWAFGAIGLDLGAGLDDHLVTIFIFAILALALNLQAGYAGLLQLGIAAFFAIGAYTAGILMVDKYPFQLGFWGGESEAERATAGFAPTTPIIGRRRVAESAAVFRASVAVG